MPPVRTPRHAATTRRESLPWRLIATPVRAFTSLFTGAETAPVPSHAHTTAADSTDASPSPSPLAARRRRSTSAAPGSRRSVTGTGAVVNARDVPTSPAAQRAAGLLDRRTPLTGVRGANVVPGSPASAASSTASSSASELLQARRALDASVRKVDRNPFAALAATHDADPVQQHVTPGVPAGRLSKAEFDDLPFGTTLRESQYDYWRAWDTVMAVAPNGTVVDLNKEDAPMPRGVTILRTKTRPTNESMAASWALRMQDAHRGPSPLVPATATPRLGLHRARTAEPYSASAPATPMIGSEATRSTSASGPAASAVQAAVLRRKIAFELARKQSQAVEQRKRKAEVMKARSTPTSPNGVPARMRPVVEDDGEEEEEEEEMEVRITKKRTMEVDVAARRGDAEGEVRSGSSSPTKAPMADAGTQYDLPTPLKNLDGTPSKNGTPSNGTPGKKPTPTNGSANEAASQAPPTPAPVPPVFSFGSSPVNSAATSPTVPLIPTLPPATPAPLPPAFAGFSLPSTPAPQAHAPPPPPAAADVPPTPSFTFPSSTAADEPKPPSTPAPAPVAPSFGMAFSTPALATPASNSTVPPSASSEALDDPMLVSPQVSGASTPATGAGAAVPLFGSAAPATPAPMTAFGTPAPPTPAAGMFSFGPTQHTPAPPAAPPTTFNFGTTPAAATTTAAAAPSTPFVFGGASAATPAPAPADNAGPAPVKPPVFNFGGVTTTTQPQAPATPAQGPGVFTFGGATPAAVTPAAPSGFGFGTPATASLPAANPVPFGFGSAATPASTAPATGFNFGGGGGGQAPATPAGGGTGFGFASGNAAGTGNGNMFSFGGGNAPATPAAAPQLPVFAPVFGNIGAATPATPANNGFTFNAPTPSNNGGGGGGAAPGAFSFGTAPGAPMFGQQQQGPSASPAPPIFGGAGTGGLTDAAPGAPGAKEFRKKIKPKKRGPQ